MTKKTGKTSMTGGVLLLLLAVFLYVLAFGIGYPQELSVGTCLEIGTHYVCNGGVVRSDDDMATTVIVRTGQSSDTIPDEHMHMPYWNLLFQKLGEHLFVWTLFSDGILTNH